MNMLKFLSARTLAVFCMATFGLPAISQVAPLPAWTATGSKINSVKTYDVFYPEKNGNVVIVKSTSGFYSKQVQETMQFSDGLGRTVQTNRRDASIAVLPNYGATPIVADIINLKRYDYDGSLQTSVKNFSYLPFVKGPGYQVDFPNGYQPAAFVLQANFWLAKHPDEQYYYNETRVERSPLGRVDKLLNQGDAFVGGNNGTVIQNELNTSAENIRIWTANPTGFTAPSTSQTYGTGKLQKTISVDERGKKVYTYTNFEGQIILKKVQEKEVGTGLEENEHDGWLCSYYVYDDLGQLRNVITPKAVKYLQANSFVFDPDVYQELCFWYDYDERGRTIIKHAPGAGTIQLVYDNKDRLVLSQDENQRQRNGKQWTFYLYDDLDRLVLTGLFDKDATRDAMATFVKNQNNGVVNITVYTGSNEIVRVDNPVAGTSGYCNSCSNTVINTVNYYDEYTYSSVKAFNNDYTFAPAETNFTSPNYNPYIEETQKTARTLDFSTGSKARVIDNNYDDGNPTNDVFLATTSYYDDKGRTIQELSDNAKLAVDYTTTQYDYSGRIISTCEKHTMPGTSMNNFATISKFDFDKIRRVTGISKKLGTQDYKKLMSLTYDEFGKIKTKKLSPDYNSGNGIETLTYDYNIQGWLIGINKDYALSTSSISQWDHYLGIYMGYDNRDNRFSAAQYNGNITGTIWRTMGDNMPRKYNYEYDNADRFTKALFTQKEKPSEINWLNSKMDFSVADIQYDENGNIKQMFQKGIIPGNNLPVFIDKLTYEYKQVGGNQWSNQLRKVFDQPDLTATNNGSLGDFKDELFASNTDDYTYDFNGNLSKDNNKKIRISGNDGIKYNYFDKPQKITIENKNTIEYTYDADGTKLAKKVTNIATGISVMTWYIGPFIYEESAGTTTLQMILHEEGRIRVYTPVSNPRLTTGGNFDLPDSKKGTYDYFVKDNLQNTRAIITEETHVEFNDCTMEDVSPNNSYYEERMFGQVDANGDPVSGSNEVSSTRVNKTDAAGWNANTTQRVSKLGYFGKKTGPNMILKVMAGDELALYTKYYYTGTPDNSAPNNMLPSILGSMLSALSYSASSINLHGAATNITTNINTTPGELGTFLSNQNTGDNSTPQAYMNVLFFDENFNFIPYDNITGHGSFAWRVEASGDGKSLGWQLARAPKNGYAFAYLSNESKTYVYFDDFKVSHTRGRLIEENAYYPHGLSIAGISGKVYDAKQNSYLYQGDFNDFEEEMDINDFELRSYDGQIGRFLQNDPYDQFAGPYTGMGNDPINYIDEDGGFTGWVGALTGAVVGGTVSGIIANHNKVKGIGLIGAITGGAVLGAGIGYATDMSFFQKGELNRFGMHFRSFYTGLIGKDGVFVNAHTRVGAGGVRVGDGYTLSPNIWDFGPIELGKWIDDTKTVWELYKTMTASTKELYQEGDVLLQERSLGKMVLPNTGPTGTVGAYAGGGEVDDVEDAGNLDPVGPGEKVKQKVLGSTYGKQPGNRVLNPEFNKDISFNRATGRLTIAQAKGYIKIGNNAGGGGVIQINKSATRYQVKYYRSQKIKIKKFRFLGVIWKRKVVN